MVFLSVSDRVKQHAVRDFSRCTPRFSEKGVLYSEREQEGVEGKDGGREGGEDADLFIIICLFLCGCVGVGVCFFVLLFCFVLLHGREEGGFSPGGSNNTY